MVFNGGGFSFAALCDRGGVRITRMVSRLYDWLDLECATVLLD